MVRPSFYALTLLALSLAACATTPTTPSAPLSRSPEFDKAVGILVDNAKDPDSATRANAIEALQDLKDARATQTISNGLHDPEWVVRFAAAMAVGHRKDEDLKAKIQQLLRSEENASVRVADIYALARLGDTSHMNELPGQLANPDPAARANTALVLGLLGNPSAIPLLAKYRNDPDTRVRFELLTAQARLGDSAAREALAGMLLSRYAQDQWALLSVCGDLPRDLTVNALLSRLKEPLPMKDASRVERVRSQLLAARSLGKLNSPQGAEFIMKNKCLEDSEPEIRSLAALAMGEILTTRGAVHVYPLLSDANPKVRLAAAAAVVNIWSRAEAGLGS